MEVSGERGDLDWYFVRVIPVRILGQVHVYGHSCPWATILLQGKSMLMAHPYGETMFSKNGRKMLTVDNIILIYFITCTN